MSMAQDHQRCRSIGIINSGYMSLIRVSTQPGSWAANLRRHATRGSNTHTSARRPQLVGSRPLINLNGNTALPLWYPALRRVLAATPPKEKESP